MYQGRCNQYLNESEVKTCTECLEKAGRSATKVSLSITLLVARVFALDVFHQLKHTESASRPGASVINRKEEKSTVLQVRREKGRYAKLPRRV